MFNLTMQYQNVFYSEYNVWRSVFEHIQSDLNMYIKMTTNHLLLVVIFEKSLVKFATPLGKDYVVIL